MPPSPSLSPRVQRAPFPAPPDAEPGTSPVLEVEIPLGCRATVVGDLLLPTTATAMSLAVADDLAAMLSEWSGPGVVVLCGDIGTHDGADAGTGTNPDEPAVAGPADALDAHPRLGRAIAEFTSTDDRRILYLPGRHERAWTTTPAGRQVLGTRRLQLASSVDLHLTTAAGERRVLVHPDIPAPEHLDTVAMLLPAAGDGEAAADQRWLDGLDRLEDPASSDRFVTSRLLYRRLGRYVWWLLVPVLAVLAIRVPFVMQGLTHVVRAGSGAGRVVIRVHDASWATRLLTVGIITAVELVVLAAVLGILSRRIWRALGGRPLPAPWRRTRQDGTQPHEEGTDRAREVAATLVTEGATGLVLGGTLRAELVHLSSGFLARPGGTTEVVREHPGVLGLPPTFLHHRQTSWVELETGADLHVRLILGDTVLPNATRLERLATGEQVLKGRAPAGELHASLVAAWPKGDVWPSAPDLARRPRRDRLVRRVTAAAIFLAGVMDIVVAINPPFSHHLRSLQSVAPLTVAQAAGALVAVAGVALIMLSRGILRGQRRTWLVTVGLLAATLVLHLVRGADVDSLMLSFCVLALLLLGRRSFRGATDRQSTRSAALALLVGVALTTVAAFTVVEVSSRVRHHPLPDWPLVIVAVLERLVGIQSVALPPHLNSFVAPALLAVGVGLVTVSLYLATRPVVARGLSADRIAGPGHRAAEIRAREIVRRQGTGTLDYFALRDDKRWFFHRDSLVAYGVYGGVCLVSPDPIGPRSERAHAWSAFRRFADRHGWSVAVTAASEEWLPIYRESGMRYLYIGDEAVVDAPVFSLEGGKMKGLRQARNRMLKYGYTVSILDPATINAEMATELIDLMGLNRRGDAERGFSMTLSRIFDPRDTGLLLTVVFDPNGRPAAMCQFVPAPSINGYSLDLMRRDPGEHPNGLLDLALCATVEHVRDTGGRGLSLNFAAMRATLEGQDGTGVTQRVERWALRQLSGVLAIESLWRYNAKFGPDWLPRYVIYESPERFVPSVTAILRSESLSEVPVIGRFLTLGAAPSPDPVTAARSE